MRKTRGLIFIVVGLGLAVLSGYMVQAFARQAAARAAATAGAPVVPPTPVPKVYVVVAQKDLAQNVAIVTGDVAREEYPTGIVPPGAIAAPEIAVGKYTTAPIYKGEVLVAPLLADTRESGALAGRVPPGKVAMAVVVNDAMNSLGALRPGDRVDILLSLDLKALEANNNAAAGSGQPAANSFPDLSTQVTMQNVEVLAIGTPAGDQAPDPSQQTAAQPALATVLTTQKAKTITFLLDHQDAVTLKFIKDSGGTMDLVVRSPDDTELAKTDAVTLDTLYRKYSFRFEQPVGH